MTSSSTGESGSPAIAEKFVLKRELRMATRREPSASPASPVATTSTSPKRGPGRPPGALIRASEQSDVLTLKAQGLSNEKISKATGVGIRAVTDLVKDPGNQAEIAARRLFLKSRTSQRLEALLEPAWDMAHQAAVTRDAKTFDAAMRGLHAGEKISASISGENQRMQVEHSGAVTTNPEPVTVQIQQLIALVKNGSGDPKEHDPTRPQQFNP